MLTAPRTWFILTSCLSELFCLFATALLRLAVSPTTELMLWRTLFTALFIPDFSLFSRVAVDTFRGESTFGSSSSIVVELSVEALGSFEESPLEFFTMDLAPIEKFLDTSIVVRIAPFSFLLALNFFKQSTVSCLWNTEATRSLWQIQGCFSASSALILLAGLTVNIWLIRFLASGVTESHSGDGKS